MQVEGQSIGTFFGEATMFGGVDLQVSSKQKFDDPERKTNRPLYHMKSTASGDIGELVTDDIDPIESKVTVKLKMKDLNVVEAEITIKELGARGVSKKLPCHN